MNLAQKVRSSPIRRLTRDVVAVTAVKVAVLTLIYVLLFGGASDLSASDAAAHIAGSTEQAR